MGRKTKGKTGVTVYKCPPENKSPQITFPRENCPPRTTFTRENCPLFSEKCPLSYRYLFNSEHSSKKSESLCTESLIKLSKIWLLIYYIIINIITKSLIFLLPEYSPLAKLNLFHCFVNIERTMKFCQNSSNFFQVCIIYLVALWHDYHCPQVACEPPHSHAHTHTDTHVDSESFFRTDFPSNYSYVAIRPCQQITQIPLITHSSC